MKSKKTEEEFVSTFSLRKKVLSFFLSLAMIFTSMQVMEAVKGDDKVYAATFKDTEEFREQIILTALKYVGYGYSQENRSGSAGTLDCSSLVRAVLQDGSIGFGNVPSTTAI